MTEKEEDRISSLPDELLLLILSFLPDSRFAATTTSLLSKRWRHLPPHCPTIHLPCHSPTAYIRTVDHCLNASRPPSPQSLELYLASDDAAIRRWTRLAAERSARELRLIGSGPEYFLPDFVFSSSHTIPSLHLSFCSINWDPNSSYNFSFLREFSLCKVDIFGTEFYELFQCCPVLENLEVDRCQSLDFLRLKIKSFPNLKRLRVNECEYLKMVVIEAPNLSFFSFVGYLSGVILGAKKTPLLYDCKFHDTPETIQVQKISNIEEWTYQKDIKLKHIFSCPPAPQAPVPAPSTALVPTTTMTTTEPELSPRQLSIRWYYFEGEARITVREKKTCTKEGSDKSVDSKKRKEDSEKSDDGRRKSRKISYDWYYSCK